MAGYSELVKMSYDEFTSEKRNLGADTNIMTSAAMARLEKVINKFNESSSFLAKINICVAIILGIIASLQLVLAFKQ